MICTWHREDAESLLSVPWNRFVCTSLYVAYGNREKAFQGRLAALGTRSGTVEVIIMVQSCHKFYSTKCSTVVVTSTRE